MHSFVLVHQITSYSKRSRFSTLVSNFETLSSLIVFRRLSKCSFYWMIISLVPMLDSMLSKTKPEELEKIPGAKISRNKIGLPRAMVAVGVVLLIVSIPIGYQAGVQKINGYFAIDSVNYLSYDASGYVNEMNVEITYHGNIVNIPHVYFRIFSNQPIINGNMYIWLTSSNVSFKPGITYNVTIEPQYQAYSINPVVGLMIVAYYGDTQGSYYIS